MLLFSLFAIFSLVLLFCSCCRVGVLLPWCHLAAGAGATVAGAHLAAGAEQFQAPCPTRPCIMLAGVVIDMACSRCSSVHDAIACLLALPVPSHACDWCCHLATRSLPSSTRSHFYLKPFGRRRRGVGNQSGASGRSWRFCSQSLAFAAACTLQICRAREILRSGLCFDLL